MIVIIRIKDEKKISATVFIVLLFTLLFSGCNEQVTDNSVEILDHKLTHYDYRPHEYYVTVKGSIKNIAGEMLETVRIMAKFYDSNNTYLATALDYEVNLQNSEAWNSNIGYFGDNAELIDHVEFDVSTS